MAKILLVEDDLMFANTLGNFLSKHGHDVDKALTMKAASNKLAKDRYDLILLDYRLPDGTGLDVLKYARSKQNTCPAIFMTRFSDVSIVVNAMRMGAFNFITKPVNPDEFLLVVNEALAAKKIVTSGAVKKSEQKVKKQMVVGSSPQAQLVEKHINLVAPTDMSVIIQGESGTGKEYVAQSIHARSDRAAKAFTAIDCGTLSNELASSELFGHAKGAFTGADKDKIGAFEVANGGTIFLDEVGNLSYEVQVKLLRAIQEREVQKVGSHQKIAIDVRILCASNDDLLKSVENGEFREDLYHRLNEFKINVAPIRQRQGDLKAFVDYFIDEANADLNKSVEAMSPEVMQLMERYSWPGNLRELRNVIRRSVLLSDGALAQKDTLPEEMLQALKKGFDNPGLDLHAIQKKTEKELIEQTLIMVKHNKSKAAKLLNIDRKTLYSKIEIYGIDA